MAIDWARSFVRDLIGWDSSLYRFLAKTLNIFNVLAKEGVDVYLKLSSLDKELVDCAPEKVSFSKLDHPLNNFIREEYAAIAPDEAPKVLVDAGAYIGDTSAYFLSKYPTARSYVIEPMKDSFICAQRNLLPYGDRVKLYQVALTGNGEPVSLAGYETGAAICASGKLTVDSITIENILELIPENQIDILKLDIEGAERLIFSSSPEKWLSRIKFIIVELHGEEAKNIVLNVLEVHKWTIKRVRNLYFCKP